MSTQTKRGGDFAHYYGELSTDKISQSWYLDRSAFSLPEEVMLTGRAKLKN